MYGVTKTSAKNVFQLTPVPLLDTCDNKLSKFEELIPSLLSFILRNGSLSIAFFIVNVSKSATT